MNSDGAVSLTADRATRRDGGGAPMTFESPAQPAAREGARETLRGFVEGIRFQRGILVLIALNAVTLGLETWPAAMAAAGGLIVAADRIMLTIFTIEIAARLMAHGRRFFRDPWSIFDVVVVGVAWLPATQGMSVLRALRVLRVLRLVSAMPRMRQVVEALLRAVPGIGAIAALLLLVFYVAAVMATKMFGPAFPDWFGSIPASLFSLFQIMTLESWSMGIVRPVMDAYPYAWAFFVPFILVATFTILNLFIAVVVGAMQSAHDAELRNDAELATAERELILAEIRSLRAHVEKLAAGAAEATPATREDPRSQ
jgi:voltage-gated sodium channel